MGLSVAGRGCARIGTALIAGSLCGVALVAGIVGAGTVSASSAAASQPFAAIGAAPVVPPGSTNLGPSPVGAALPLMVSLEPQDPAGLTSFLTQVYDPSSPAYHQFLAQGQFGPRFGASPAAISAVRATLSSLGLSGGSVSPNDLVLSFTTSVGVAETAFSISIDQFRLATGHTGFANTTAPKVPSAIQQDITGIVGLSTLSRVAPLGLARSAAARSASARGRRDAESPGSVPTACNTAKHVGTSFTATELARAYGFVAGAYDHGRFGTGATIALFEAAAYTPTTVAKYEKCYGISTKVAPIKVTGGSTTTRGTGAVEADLDIEDVAGLAPKATIDVYEAPTFFTSVLHEYTAIASADSAQVVSSSWGTCEIYEGSTLVDAEELIFEEMAADGQSMMAAAGDTGSEGCQRNGAGTLGLNVGDPSGDPYVTGVGGTDITALGTPPTEKVWNEGVASDDGAGGGGISKFWKMPAYQSALGVNQDSSGKPCAAAKGTYCREVPDVSASADYPHGYAIYFDGHWYDVGGTSASSPLWAALTGLADEACGARSGLLNAALYAHPSDLHDITVGTNTYDSKLHTGLYPATTGYDMASGLGTPTSTLFKRGVLCTSPATRPARPQAPRVTAGNASVTAKWKAPATRGSPITQYVVTSTTLAHSCTWTTGPLTCTVTTLANGHGYRFRVVAHNAIGTSKPSPYSVAVKPKA